MKPQEKPTRLEKGNEIANNQDNIKRIDDNHYQVKSQSSEKWYDVIATEKGWMCTCPDHTFRKLCCKHSHSVELSIKLRKEIQQNITIEPIEVNSCPKC